MMCEEVARRNVPPPGNSYSPVRNSNTGLRENFSRKPSFVLGSHDVRRGGMRNHANPYEDIPPLFQNTGYWFRENSFSKSGILVI
ncbi:hypothetical protein HZH68_006439 [Vespula germanica]|uniref:Uncharacterized protein n=1 Tax=Vespula germanica TaxID=30212 RepID=A0A834KBS6_VESGE|nr:hypothetical protein HZH68_006439 [Vespula germanica]